MILTTPTTAQVIENLSVDELNLVLIGEKNPLDIAGLLQFCNDNNIVIAGGILPGIISQSSQSDSGVLIKNYPATTEVAVFKDLQNSTNFNFPKLKEHQHSSLLFIDGLSTKISFFLEQTYAFYWDKIKFIGGGCGSLSLVQQPCVFSNEGFFQDAALMLFLEADLQAGVKHGWKKLSGPCVVSSAEGNVIHELNWRPAFEVYKETLSENGAKEINPDNFFSIAKAFPFGIYKEGAEDIVRDPILTDGKSLTCVGEVTSNSVVNILNGNASDLIAGAEQAAIEAFSADDTHDALIVDCISRSLFQDKEFSGELNKINKVINQKKLNIPLEGILSLGEISSYGDGYLEFFNKTIVVGAFRNHDR